MIKDIVRLLKANDWLVGDEDIDIAKGLYAIPNNRKELKILKKKWRLRKQHI